MKSMMVAGELKEFVGSIFEQGGGRDCISIKGLSPARPVSYVLLPDSLGML